MSQRRPSSVIDGYSQADSYEVSSYSPPIPYTQPLSRRRLPVIRGASFDRRYEEETAASSRRERPHSDIYSSHRSSSVEAKKKETAIGQNTIAQAAKEKAHKAAEVLEEKVFKKVKLPQEVYGVFHELEKTNAYQTAKSGVQKAYTIVGPILTKVSSVDKEDQVNFVIPPHLDSSQRSDSPKFSAAYNRISSIDQSITPEVIPKIQICDETGKKADYDQTKEIELKQQPIDSVSAISENGSLNQYEVIKLNKFYSGPPVQKPVPRRRRSFRLRPSVSSQHLAGEEETINSRLLSMESTTDDSKLNVPRIGNDKLDKAKRLQRQDKIHDNEASLKAKRGKYIELSSEGSKESDGSGPKRTKIKGLTEAEIREQLKDKLDSVVCINGKTYIIHKEQTDTKRVKLGGASEFFENSTEYGWESVPDVVGKEASSEPTWVSKFFTGVENFFNNAHDPGFAESSRDPLACDNCGCMDGLFGSGPKRPGIDQRNFLMRRINAETFCVVSKRFRKNYVHRFSASKSLFLFSPWNPIRRAAIYLSTNQYFDYIVMSTIMLNCIFLAMSKPVIQAEYIFLAIYSMEMVVKVIAKGFIINKYTYLRNPWNWLDFVVIASGYVTFIIELGDFDVELGNLAGLRTFRVLRALKTISIMPGLKTIINALLNSIKQLVEVMTLTVFCLMVFALFALQVYMGVLKNKCVLDMGEGNYTDEQWGRWIRTEDHWFLENGTNHPNFGDPILCGNATGARKCPNGYSCLDDIGDNPNFGYTTFDSFIWSMLTTFQLITLDFWEDVYNKVIATGGPLQVFFFAIVVFFGSFYLINLMLAVVAMSYEEEAENTEEEKTKDMSEHLNDSTFSFDPDKLTHAKPLERRRKSKSGRVIVMRKGAAILSPPKRKNSAASDKTKESSTSKTSLKVPKETSLNVSSSVTSGPRPSSIIVSPPLVTASTPTPEDKKVSMSDSRGKETRTGYNLAADVKRCDQERCCKCDCHKDHGPGQTEKNANEEQRPYLRLADEPSNKQPSLDDSGVVGDHEVGDSGSLQLHSQDQLESKGEIFVRKNLSHLNPSSPTALSVSSQHIVVIDDDLVDRNCEKCADCCIQYNSWLRFQSWVYLIVHDAAFDLFIMLCIILNTSFLAAEHHGMSNELNKVLEVGNRVFTVVFTLECMMKIMALSKEFFANGWNVFDLIIVLASLLDLGLEIGSGLSVLRGMRLLRVLKLAQSWRTMRVLLSIIVSTLGALGNLTFVLIIVIYIFAVIGMQLFGKNYTAEKFSPEPVPRWNFTDFFHSFMMIFRILCGEWVEPLWDCMRAAGKESQTCLAIFLPALVMGNFMVLNLFLAMLLNSFNSEELKSRQDDMEDESRVLDLIIRIWNFFAPRRFQKERPILESNELHHNNTHNPQNPCNEEAIEENTQAQIHTTNRRLDDIQENPTHTESASSKRREEDHQSASRGEEVRRRRLPKVQPYQEFQRLQRERRIKESKYANKSYSVDHQYPIRHEPTGRYGFSDMPEYSRFSMYSESFRDRGVKQAFSEPELPYCSRHDDDRHHLNPLERGYKRMGFPVMGPRTLPMRPHTQKIRRRLLPHHFSVNSFDLNKSVHNPKKKEDEFGRDELELSIFNEKLRHLKESQRCNSDPRLDSPDESTISRLFSNYIRDPSRFSTPNEELFLKMTSPQTPFHSPATSRSCSYRELYNQALSRYGNYSDDYLPNYPSSYNFPTKFFHHKSVLGDYTHKPLDYRENLDYSTGYYDFRERLKTPLSNDNYRNDYFIRFSSAPVEHRGPKYSFLRYPDSSNETFLNRNFNFRSNYNYDKLDLSDLHYKNSDMYNSSNINSNRHNYPRDSGYREKHATFKDEHEVKEFGYDEDFIPDYSQRSYDQAYRQNRNLRGYDEHDRSYKQNGPKTAGDEYQSGSNEEIPEIDFDEDDEASKHKPLKQGGGASMPSAGWGKVISYVDELTVGVKDDTDPRFQRQEKKKKEPFDCFPKYLYNNLSCCQWFTGTRAYAIWYQIRQFCMSIADNTYFEWTVLGLIMASSITLCFEDVNLDSNPELSMILNYLNLLFAVVFTFEMLLKWIAYGFVKYFTSAWTILDCFIVMVSLCSLFIEQDNLIALRSLRTLRALRPLRAISRWQGMKIVVNALMYAIPSIFNVLLVCLVFWLIFSIMGVQMFGGKFFKCVDEDGERLEIDVVNNKSECLENPNFTWENSNINFDNVFQAYLALFQVATFEGWMEVMMDAIDARGIDMQPSREAFIYAYIYFVVFIVCGSFFTLNLFIGVIIDNFNALKKKYEGGVLEMFLTDSQKNYYTAMKKLGRKKPQKVIRRPTNHYQAIFYDISVSRRFEISIFVLIFLNMVTMAIEHDHQSRTIAFTLEVFNALFTTIFGLEAILKIIGLRHHYFTVPWNLFDFILVFASILGILLQDVLTNFPISPTLLRVVRVFRIGRILRLIKAAKGIRKLLFALVVSLPALINIGALLFLITFIYAIIGMSVFGHVQRRGALDDLVNFETFGSSMMLLFRLITSAGWNDVLDPLMTQPPDCDPHYKNQPNGNCGQPMIAIGFFVSFIIINFMIVINMYIAVILENFNQAHKEEEIGIVEDDLEMFYVRWSKYDPHATQFINFNQLSDFIASLDVPFGIPKPNIIALVSFDLPIAKDDKIHCLDILHALTKHVLGHVEETEEFKKLKLQMEEKFKKQFPTRKELEIISSTRRWKKMETAARIIQKTWKLYKRAQKEIERRNRVQEERETQTSSPGATSMKAGFRKVSNFLQIVPMPGSARRRSVTVLEVDEEDGRSRRPSRSSPRGSFFLPLSRRASRASITSLVSNTSEIPVNIHKSLTTRSSIKRQDNHDES